MLYATIAALAASLVFFVWIALRERIPVTSLDEYLTARGTQGALTRTRTASDTRRAGGSSDPPALHRSQR